MKNFILKNLDEWIIQKINPNILESSDANMKTICSTLAALLSSLQHEKCFPKTLQEIIDTVDRKEVISLMKTGSLCSKGKRIMDFEKFIEGVNNNCFEEMEENDKFSGLSKQALSKLAPEVFVLMTAKDVQKNSSAVGGITEDQIKAIPELSTKLKDYKGSNHLCAELHKKEYKEKLAEGIHDLVHSRCFEATGVRSSADKIHFPLVVSLASYAFVVFIV
jgi:hypothetical protein